MKRIKISCISIFVLIVLSTIAFAMGGPAPETPKTEAPEVQPQTAEAQPVVATKEGETGDFEKAQAELTSLEAEREKIDSYLETLNKKIIKAKTAKDAKKLSELQAIENTMSNRENLVTERILAIKQKYYELKPVEKSEAPKKEEKPGQIEMPKAVNPNIVYHEVAMGDTLSNISKKYFGTSIYYKKIAKMNNITDIGHLTQGAKLKIDLNIGGQKAAAAKRSTKVVPKPTGGIIYHVVAAGDSLMSISRQYFNGSASYYRQIAEMNGLTGASPLRVGMKLKIDKNLKLKPKQPSL